MVIKVCFAFEKVFKEIRNNSEGENVTKNKSILIKN